MDPRLLAFVLLVAGDALALLCDLALSSAGWRTITATVRACPALGVPLVLWQAAAAVALGLHFWGPAAPR